jgi:alginate O-acetyltransferase complex protein AlgI
VLFNSFSFIIFLVVSFGVYHLIQRFRWPRLLWLLLISAFFYGCWEPWYLILIAISTVTSYVIGAVMARTDEPVRRKRLLILGISTDLAMLCIFKYGNFFLKNIEYILGALGVPLELGRVPGELPVGISFYTFQTLSYTIDLYRKKIEPARNLLEFSVFVAFFPQLVAGPIVRAADFLPQLLKRPRMDRKAIGQGIFLILVGLFKKMVIADSLYQWVVRPFFKIPDGHNAVETVMVLWAANFQVYCDFSGYSDVAIGAALLFGFQLPLNFNRPFWSRTPMEHWRRWHISLSTWLRDYLYFPLGGSRGGPWATDRNLIITFLLGGLWHGAGWTFLVWGLYNGILLAIWRRYGPAPATSKAGIALETFITFNSICFGLVFLHAHSFSDAGMIMLSLLDPLGEFTGVFDVYSLGMLAFAAALHWTPQDWKTRLQAGFAEAPAWTLAIIIVLTGGVLSLFAGFSAPFFYFQF